MLIKAVTASANAASPTHSIPRNPGMRAVLLVLPFVTALLTSSLMLTKIVAWKYIFAVYLLFQISDKILAALCEGGIYWPNLKSSYVSSTVPSVHSIGIYG